MAQTPYVSSDEVRRFLPANSRLDGDFIDQLVLEAGARVQRDLKVEALPPGDAEIAGIVRDLAASRALEKVFGMQNSGTVQGAIALRTDALSRLRGLDLSEAKPGEEDNRAVADPADSVGNTVGGLWGPGDAYSGYMHPGYRGW